MAENSSPIESMDLRSYAHCDHAQLRQCSETLVRPRYVQTQGPLGTGDSMHCGYNKCFDFGLGRSMRGHSNLRSVIRVTEQVVHKMLGTESGVFSLSGLSATAGTATCGWIGDERLKMKIMSPFFF